MLIYAPVFIIEIYILKAYSISHPCSHYTQHITSYIHSTGEVSRVALKKSEKGAVSAFPFGCICVVTYVSSPLYAMSKTVR